MPGICWPIRPALSSGRPAHRVQYFEVIQWNRPGDPGVCNQDVDAPGFVEGARDRALDTLTGAHVGLDHSGTPPELGNLRSERLSRGRLPRGHNEQHVRALAR
jgi:hypothetical protein